MLCYDITQHKTFWLKIILNVRHTTMCKNVYLSKFQFIYNLVKARFLHPVCIICFSNLSVKFGKIFDRRYIIILSLFLSTYKKFYTSKATSISILTCSKLHFQTLFIEYCEAGVPVLSIDYSNDVYCKYKLIWIHATYWR